MSINATPNRSKHSMRLWLIVLLASVLTTACGVSAATDSGMKEAGEQAQVAAHGAETPPEDPISSSKTSDTDAKQIKATRVEVIRVIDGDTIDVEPLAGPELPSKRIRLIGVNTPEIHGQVEDFGQEAADFTKQRLEGRTVWLTRDVSETDRYNRALRFVWLSEPGEDIVEETIRDQLFNAVLLLHGYASVATYPPDVHYAGLFRKFSSEARQARRGLWAVGSNGSYDSTKANRPIVPSGSKVPTSSPSGDHTTYDPSGPDRDCSDFSTHAEAQAFFIAAGGPGADRHRLDSDHDDVACETLP